MHRIFSGDGWLVVLDIRKSARDHRRSQPLVQQRPVLIILCILCIHVQQSGHEDLLFHSQMIHPIVAEGVANHSSLSTIHSIRYCRRRAVRP